MEDHHEYTLSTPQASSTGPPYGRDIFYPIYLYRLVLFTITHSPTHIYAQSSHMASRQDLHTIVVSKKSATPGAALKRYAALIYKFLKPKASRLDSEHLLFTRVTSIMELIPPTEKAALHEREIVLYCIVFVARTEP